MKKWPSNTLFAIVLVPMSVFPTVQETNSVLRGTAMRVEDVQATEIQQVITDLIDTMRAAELVGIAAPQIGHSWQIFVIELRKTTFRNGEEVAPLTIFINPTITCVSRETNTDWEGCGSVQDKGVFAKVERPAQVTIEYLDETGEKRTLTATGLLARCIQHEYDHLQGILFSDKVEPEELVSHKEYLKKQEEKR